MSSIVFQFPNAKIGIVIPAYNEGKNLEKVLQLFPSNISNKLDLIVVNDASTDNTQEIARKYHVVLINHKKNLGYGGAIQTGLKYCIEQKYDVVITLDADGQHDPKYIPMLIKPILNYQADFVKGNRYHHHFKHPDPYKDFFSKSMGILYSILFHKRIHDPTNGYRAFSRKLLENEKFESNYTITQEMLFKIIPKYHFQEIEIVVKPRINGESFITFSKYLKNTLITFKRHYIDEKFPFLKGSLFLIYIGKMIEKIL